MGCCEPIGTSKEITLQYRKRPFQFGNHGGQVCSYYEKMKSASICNKFHRDKHFKSTKMNVEILVDAIIIFLHIVSCI